jgi:hypothetical protein
MYAARPSCQPDNILSGRSPLGQQLPHLRHRVVNFLLKENFAQRRRGFGGVAIDAGDCG